MFDHPSWDPFEFIGEFLRREGWPVTAAGSLASRQAIDAQIYAPKDSRARSWNGLVFSERRVYEVIGWLRWKEDRCPIICPSCQL